MITLFEQRYNTSSFTNDELGVDEVYLFLNLSVERFINTRFTGNNPRQQAFEGGDRKRIEDLRTLLIVSGDITSASTNTEIPNSDNFALPADYRFYINSYSNIDKTINGTARTNAWVENDKIENDEVSEFIDTHYNRPIIDNPKAVLRSGVNLTILIDTETTLNKIKIQYIKQPDVIASGTNCNLPDQTHEEIVEGAVTIALEPTESKRFQTQDNILKSSE